MRLFRPSVIAVNRRSSVVLAVEAVSDNKPVGFLGIKENFGKQWSHFRGRN